MPRDLLEMYRNMAATGGQFRGLSVLRYADDIGAVREAHDARTLLDYGSGGGDAYRHPWLLHERWGVERPTLYDPAFPEHSELPRELFDGVICSDVLEHVDEQRAPAVVRELFSHAIRFVWASVCCRPAKKYLPDGRNAHVTLKPMSWWRNRFAKAATLHPEVAWYLVESE